MTVFTWKGERDTIMTPTGFYSLLQTFFTNRFNVNGATNRNIKAWVGGINYKYFQYDHVAQGARQVGSTFKPFVYATAIEQLHISPCDTLSIHHLPCLKASTALMLHGARKIPKGIIMEW